LYLIIADVDALSTLAVESVAVELAAAAVELAAGAVELAAGAVESAVAAVETAAGAVEFAMEAVELARSKASNWERLQVDGRREVLLTHQYSTIQ
jgi:hypothetical protein